MFIVYTNQRLSAIRSVRNITFILIIIIYMTNSAAAGDGLCRYTILLAKTSHLQLRHKDLSLDIYIYIYIHTHTHTHVYNFK